MEVETNEVVTRIAPKAELNLKTELEVQLSPGQMFEE